MGPRNLHDITNTMSLGLSTLHLFRLHRVLVHVIRNNNGNAYSQLYLQLTNSFSIQINIPNPPI